MEWLIGGIFAWFFTDYVTKPLRRFHNLRRDVNRCLVRYGNVSARGRRVGDGVQATGISPEQQEKIAAAESAFRDVGDEMRAFANVDSVADRI